MYEAIKTDDTEMGSNGNTDCGCDDDSYEYIPDKRSIERVWRDIVDYCRSFDEGQTTDCC